MACAGVVASAGAQLDFTVMTVATYSIGKSSVIGFRSGSGGSLSNNTLEFSNGTAYTITHLEDQGSTIVLISSGFPSSKPSIADSFRRIVIGDLSLNQADTSSYGGTSTGFAWTSTNQAIADANGSTITVELRAD